MLTTDQLDAMPPGHIFARGEIVDAPEGAHMAGTGKMMRWVAVRGDVADWAIYSQNPHYIDSDDPLVIECGYNGVWDWEKIRQEGDKIGGVQNIKNCVPCDDAALARYRY